MIREFNISELIDVLSADLKGADVAVKNISTDTRNIQKGDLFVALKGHNFNGHKFLAQAKASGAVAAVVDELVEDDGGLPLLCVADALIALGKIAAWNRQQFKGLVTAVTGSAGKTSVKSMMADVLSASGNVLATKGNLNNHIGAPLTLLELDEAVTNAVIELGASGQGEIDYTAQLTQPDIAVITNVSGAHLEGFGSIEIIAQTKGEIIDAVHDGGYVVLNHDDQFFAQWVERAKGRQVVSFGHHEDADVRAININCHENGCDFDVVVKANQEGDQQVSVKLPLLGEHNVMNALAAIGVGISAGIKLEVIAEKLASLSAVAGRMQWRESESGVRILDDSYNASPASVKAAIDVIKLWKDKAWLVLGDMAELGAESKHIHEEIGEYAKQEGLSNFVAVGKYCRYAVEAFGDGGHWFAHQADLIKFLQKTVQVDHVILVKGARSAAMDKVVTAMIEMPACSNSLVGDQ